MWLTRPPNVRGAMPAVMNINDLLSFGLGWSNVGSTLPVRRRFPNVANSAAKRPRRAKCQVESLIMESNCVVEFNKHKGVHINHL